MSLTPNGSKPHEMEDISSRSTVIVGCRKSELALTQARSIISALSQTIDPSPTFEIATASVAGDADKQTPFALLSKQTGGSDIGKSLWTNGLEKDLVAGKVQVLIHCLKDMPTTLPPKCLLAAVPEREDCSDAVVMRSDSDFTSIDQLPPGSIVGSSSSRRRALVRRNWPHLEVAECRGNLDTRLAKLDAPSSPFSCILLATAGLLRLGLGHRITQRLEPTIFPYAVGQGALGIEVSTDIDRQDILQLVQHVDHKPSRWRGMAERAMLRSLQGGCSSSIGVWSSFEPKENDPVDDNQGSDSGILRLRATVIHIEGLSEISSEDVGTVQCDEEAERLGISVANMLLNKGVRDLLPEQS
ncbi:Tetrapyrrole biosynthesis hydroxymethylbilane synthase [Penicillium robsamsonii]|uniref:Tetrapyrrole biosynthesis hydroxymethylbilane synthase n=1 Tax=Penicillium robsamsonii TaxID=1792511 RepID=UPI00254878EB|nr:Tetrapyrrole biosynthesis hydroxymethylbilane synthase [Penicillium robsamsonii]KAJ5836934.1 Tetrapyrrole biosynthesis hydroxymethylbilane synthase [Penicillium robsamsonii]